jgi:glutamate dehydrogenase/leucine dehydrogenase
VPRERNELERRARRGARFWKRRRKHIARLVADGAKVIAACDSKAGLYAEAASTLGRRSVTKTETKSLAGLPGAKEISPEDIIGVDCDILLPSALENAITLANVGQVKAKIIAELANGPTTPGADRVLEDEGVFLIPDILANAGGVTVSYYEWVQDQYSFFWSEKQINDTLEQTMQTRPSIRHETANVTTPTCAPALTFWRWIVWPKRRV